MSRLLLLTNASCVSHETEKEVEINSCKKFKKRKERECVCVVDSEEVRCVSACFFRKNFFCESVFEFAIRFDAQTVISRQVQVGHVLQTGMQIEVSEKQQRRLLREMRT